MNKYLNEVIKLGAENEMKVISYDNKYKNQVIDLVLYIQNVEYSVGLSIEDQPDLVDIKKSYFDDGGSFWIAIDDKDKVIGTLGLQKGEKNIGILKKFFVHKNHRGKEFGISMKLYEQLLKHAKMEKMNSIILDTPSIAIRAHSFYKKAGFKEITKKQLPISYEFADRDSLLFMLKLV